MRQYIAYLYQTEEELLSSNTDNLRHFSIRANNELEAMIEAHEVIEIFEQYDGFHIHSIKKAS